MTNAKKCMLHICFKCNNSITAKGKSLKDNSNVILYGCRYGIDITYNKITECTGYDE